MDVELLCMTHERRWKIYGMADGLIILINFGFLYIFFFLRRYNFIEVLAFSTSVFHLVRSLMQSFQFVIFILVMSLFTSSSHLLFGLPSDLVSAGDHSYAFVSMLLSGIRCTCPNQANLCALM